MKIVLPRAILTAIAISCLCAIAAWGQAVPATTQITPTTTMPAKAPAKAIGAAPANSKQSKVLAGALSPETRQTLQDAMNASFADDTTPPAHSK